MPKVKIAPDLWEFIRPSVVGDRVPRPLTSDVINCAQNQYRALLAVARAVARWRDYDGDRGSMCNGSTWFTVEQSLLVDLERISKGEK